ncbi:MAG: NAD(P)H-binding protein [Candidatus Obscuribacter sp.]|nr:NAD(P)H-binding protein [Candidatus Obscuribacter sp.]MBK9206423.1 NAD(P)H-binding protein [Candidatus Obscuribacter sp.]
MDSTSPKPLAQVKVLVDGATGYVGQHLVQVLRQAGFAVVCLVRPQARQVDIDFLAGLGATICKGQLTMPQSGASPTGSFFDGVELAVHLIGSIAPKRGESFNELHTANARSFASWCKLAGVKRAVMVTALGADKNSASNYLKTKALAEEAAQEILGDGLAIVRPSLILGRQCGTRDSKLIKRYLDIITTKAFVPLVGGGESLVQPLYVVDLAKAITACLVRGNVHGVNELGGPEQISLKTIVQKLCALKGVNKPVLNVPPFVASGVASIAERLMEVPTLSRDQALLATMDNVTSNNQIDLLLGQEPTSLDSALKTYG